MMLPARSPPSSEKAGGDEDNDGGDVGEDRDDSSA